MALCGARLRQCRRDPAAQVRLQHRRRPRAPCRVPGRGLAPGVRSRDRADRQRVQRLPHRAHGRRVRHRPRTAGVPTTRTRTTSSWPVHLRWRQQRQRYCNEEFDALMTQAASEPDQDCAGRALQAGADDPDGRRSVHPAALRRSPRTWSSRMSRASFDTPIDSRAPGRPVLRDHPDPEALVALRRPNGGPASGRPTGIQSSA